MAARGVDLDGERARIVALGGEEVDEIGDATAIAGQRAVVAGLCRGDEGNGELMLREGRLEVGIGGPHLGLARKLQRVEIGPRLIAPRLGFAHPVVPDEAVEQLPAELKPDAPRWFFAGKTSCRSGPGSGCRARDRRGPVRRLQITWEDSRRALDRVPPRAPSHPRTSRRGPGGWKRPAEAMNSRMPAAPPAAAGKRVTQPAAGKPARSRSPAQAAPRPRGRHVAHWQCRIAAAIPPGARGAYR